MIKDSVILNEAHNYFQKKAPVLYFVLSTEGEIVDANQYAIRLTGRQLIGEKIQDVIVDFTGTFDLSGLINDQSKEHLLNIKTDSGLPQSFYFSFREVNDHVLTFGRLDAEEIENMRKSCAAIPKNWFFSSFSLWSWAFFL